MSCLVSSGLVPVNYSGYHCGHLTETTLLKIYNDFMAADKRVITLVILLGYSAAFDKPSSHQAFLHVIDVMNLCFIRALLQNTEISKISKY